MLRTHPGCSRFVLSLVLLVPMNMSVWGGGLASTRLGQETGEFIQIDRLPSAVERDSASTVRNPSFSPAAPTRLEGTVSALDLSAKTFSIAGLTVSYKQESIVLPLGEEMTIGKRVTVFADTAIEGNTLNAKALVVRGQAASTVDVARVVGRVRQLDSANLNFVVDGVRVDASSAAFVNGATLDLNNGRKLRAYGHFKNSQMVAAEIRFIGDSNTVALEPKDRAIDFAIVESRSALRAKLPS
jgi:hypothetical protein